MSDMSPKESPLALVLEFCPVTFLSSPPVSFSSRFELQMYGNWHQLMRVLVKAFSYSFASQDSAPVWISTSLFLWRHISSPKKKWSRFTLTVSFFFSIWLHPVVISRQFWFGFDFCFVPSPRAKKGEKMTRKKKKNVNSDVNWHGSSLKPVIKCFWFLANFSASFNG